MAAASAGSTVSPMGTDRMVRRIDDNRLSALVISSSNVKFPVSAEPGIEVGLRARTLDRPFFRRTATLKVPDLTPLWRNAKGLLDKPGYVVLIWTAVHQINQHYV